MAEAMARRGASVTGLTLPPSDFGSYTQVTVHVGSDAEPVLAPARQFDVLCRTVPGYIVDFITSVTIMSSLPLQAVSILVIMSVSIFI